MITRIQAFQALHYGCAIGAALLVSVSALIRLGRVEKSAPPAPRPRSPLLLLLFITIFLTYLGEGIAASIDDTAFRTKQAHAVHLAISVVAWAVVALRRDGTRALLGGVSAVTMIFEIPLLVLCAVAKPSSTRGIVSFCCQALRLLAVLVLLSASIGRSLGKEHRVASEEGQPFLQASSHNGDLNSNGYGSLPCREDSNTEDFEDDSDDDSDDGASIKRRRAQRLKETGGWLGYLKDFSIFIPYIIPKNDRKVQFSIFLCLLCLAAGRVLNIMIPVQLGKVTDLVLHKEAPYGALLGWLLVTLLNGESGIGLIEALAKVPIKQFSYRQVTNGAFGHVMNLSMEFHSERDSAEVMKAIEQGESLTNLLETAVIDILPTVVDLFISFWLLYSKFNIYVALAMLVALSAFTGLEVYTSNTNVDNRRASSKAQREEAKVMHQAVQGWQTVTYFSMLGFERRRFARAVDAQLDASRKYDVRDAVVQALLELTIPLTFFTLAALVLHEINAGRATAGDFVFLIQYWEFLMWPIKLLSHNYRFLMKDLVDAERLLDLLQTKPTVVERQDARELRDVEGHVAFENVGFAYDPRRPTIRDLNIAATPGQTVALVGETGAGKSSVMKLLLRFYDVTEGRITIDGHDVRDVTLSSLRAALGVVPQDPLLFNASVMENLRYARPGASDAEVFEACRAAAIHDRVLSFPDGYESRVGEQGVKLSGGEIQRLAIARVFLKDPPVLILDEATSAVDTKTEASIQGALEALKSGRTTFVIAHRLSTIVNADKIVVIHDGSVVESGTHKELLEKGGRYKDLWTRQVGGSIEKHSA